MFVAVSKWLKCSSQSRSGSNRGSTACVFTCQCEALRTFRSDSPIATISTTILVSLNRVIRCFNASAMATNGIGNICEMQKILQLKHVIYSLEVADM